MLKRFIPFLAAAILGLFSMSIYAELTDCSTPNPGWAHCAYTTSTDRTAQKYIVANMDGIWSLPVCFYIDAAFSLYPQDLPIVGAGKHTYMLYQCTDSSCNTKKPLIIDPYTITNNNGNWSVSPYTRVFTADPNYGQNCQSASVKSHQLLLLK